MYYSENFFEKCLILGYFLWKFSHFWCKNIKIFFFSVKINFIKVNLIISFFLFFMDVLFSQHTNETIVKILFFYHVATFARDVQKLDSILHTSEIRISLRNINFRMISNILEKSSMTQRMFNNLFKKRRNLQDVAVCY